LVELKIAAAGIREGAHRLAIGLAPVGEERIQRRIGFFADGFAAGAAVERRRRRNGDLRGLRRMRLAEAEMLDHGMAGKGDLADGPRPFGTRAHAGKGDPLRHLVALDAVEAPEEIEMPPRAAELAVGDRLQSRLLLPLDGPGDLAVLDLLQLPRIDL